MRARRQWRRSQSTLQTIVKNLDFRILSQMCLESHGSLGNGVVSMGPEAKEVCDLI